MKKLNVKKILLILLPILAVGLATTVDSVMVYDSVAGTTEYYSYFDLVPDCSYQIVMPLAAILSIVAGILAAVYIVGKKQGCLKGILVTTFCAATFAVLPNLLHGDVMVVPNVGLPLFMFVDCGLAYIMMKKPDKQEEAKASRLDRR